MIVARYAFIPLAAVACFGLATEGLAKAPTKKSGSKKSATPPSSAKSDSDAETKTSAAWQVIKIGNRDYLAVDNVAKFYGLTVTPDSTGKVVVLNGSADRKQMQLTKDTREAVINGVRNWLCFPVINQDGKFFVSRADLAKTIEPQFRPHMIQRNSSVQTVVIDAGHGGFDKGAQCTFGSEKNFALDIARRLRPLLQAKGFRVIMTRENDVFLPLDLRARIANQTHDSIFVSIHLNATSNRDATGFEIFSLTPRGAPSTSDDALALSFTNMQEGSAVDAQSFELSTTVYHSMIGHFPEFDRGIKRARFAVLRRTKIPAILVEGGFLSQDADSKLIANPAWRTKLAESISIGVENYRNVTERKQPPMLAADYRAQVPAASAITLTDLAQPPARLEAPSSFGAIAVTPESSPDAEP